MKRNLFAAAMLLLIAGPVLAGCGASAPTATPLPPPTSTPVPPTPVPPTATVGARAASQDDLALIQQALTTTAALKSFHLVQTLTGSMAPASRDVEGDYVASDGLYAKGSVGSEQGSFLLVGTQNYKQDASGNWVAWTDPAVTTPQTQQEIIGGFFTGLGPIASLSDFQNMGAPETLNGVSVQHFAGTIPISKLPGVPDAVATMTGLPPAGTLALWIDPAAKIVYKVDMNVDTGPAMAAAASKMGTPDAATPAPGQVVTLALQMTISRPNDPTIKIPAPPSSTSGLAATPTVGTRVAGPTTAGPTPTSVTLPLAASDGHNSTQSALALTGPTHVDLTLNSPQDVVYFSFRTGAPVSAGLWFYNPQDSAGQLQVQLLDAGGQNQFDPDKLNPGDQSSQSVSLPTPGVYLIKVTAAGLTKVPQTPVQIELDSLDPLTP